MEKHPEYFVHFINLPQGIHEFEFKVGNAFFDHREHGLIHQANLDVKAILTKGNNSMSLEIRMLGDITLECGRCLEEYKMPVSEVKNLVIRMVSEPAQQGDDEDAINIPLHAHSIDLAPHLYDFISLKVPLNPVHPDDDKGNPGCDPEALKLIKSFQKGNDGKDNPWEVLKKLRLN